MCDWVGIRVVAISLWLVRWVSLMFGLFGVESYPKLISVSDSCLGLKSVGVMTWAWYEEWVLKMLKTL
jgi:hypothetical protein